MKLLVLTFLLLRPIRAHVSSKLAPIDSADDTPVWEKAIFDVVDRFFVASELHIMCQNPSLCFTDSFLMFFNKVVTATGHHNHYARADDNFLVVASNWRAALTLLSLVSFKTGNRAVISWVKNNDPDSDMKDVDELFRSVWELLLVDVVVILIPPVNNETTINMYSFLPFRNGSKCFDTNAVLVDVWTSGNFSKNSDLFPADKVTQLNGCPLRVTSFEDEPQTWIDVFNGTEMIRGFAYPLLREVSLAMNFSIEARLPEDRSFWGSENSGMFGDLRQNKTDIGFAETPLKAKVVDVSSCNVVSCVTWCVPIKYERQSASEKLSREFSPLVWVLLALSCALVAFAIHFLSSIARTEVRRMSYGRALVLTVSPLIGAVVRYLPLSSSVRFFTAHWLFFSLVMSSAYQAGLHTANTIPASSVRFETVQDLERSDLNIVLIEDMMTLLIQSTVDNPELIVFLRRAQLYKDGVVDILQNIAMHGNDATLISLDYCRYFKEKHEASGAQFPYELHGFTSYCLASPAVGYFSLRHGSPFAPRIRQLETRLSEAGLLQKWVNKAPRRRSKLKDGPHPLSLESVEPAFALLVGALVIAACTFICELLLHWRFQRLRTGKNGAVPKPEPPIRVNLGAQKKLGGQAIKGDTRLSGYNP